eukprot:359722-Chlamydomonas_euryale.AAC.5
MPRVRARTHRARRRLHPGHGLESGPGGPTAAADCTDARRDWGADWQCARHLLPSHLMDPRRPCTGAYAPVHVCTSHDRGVDGAGQHVIA